MNARHPSARKMSAEEVEAYLDEAPGWMILTTIGEDGYPHSIPLGYFRREGAIYLGTRSGTRKLHNIGHNPRVSLLVESGTTMETLKGVMIQGDAVIIVSSSASDSTSDRSDPTDPQPPPGGAYIRVVPKRVISWDYGPSRG